MGVKFKDADLIGVLLQVIVCSIGLKTGKIEIKERKDNKKVLISKDKAVECIKKIC